MTNNVLKHELTGTRIGCEIRFTCPGCQTENVIVNRSPKDHYKRSRDATCKQCKARATVLTPIPDYKPESFSR